MTILTDKLILFTASSILLFSPVKIPQPLQVVSVLITISFTCLMSCLNTNFVNIQKLPEHFRKICCGFSAVFVLFTLLFEPLRYYLPLLAYEMAVLFLPCPRNSCDSKETRPEQNFKHKKMYVLLAYCLFLLLVIQISRSPAYALLFPLCALAAYLSRKSTQLLHVRRSLHFLRDSSTENQILLKQKNQNLIRQQDYEIHVATLKERNRIAREIHDNVGHMLSRSILQAGALSALNRQKQLTEPLNDLKTTLNSAMDSIRESVHGLHDDSVDLENSIREILKDFSAYQLTLDYDIGFAVPASIKYCFISVVKEALSNIARHSNATAISITLRQHPLLYQLAISDNGSADEHFCPGMGISNMEERIRSLNGNISISTDHGFRIFISVPVS